MKKMIINNIYIFSIRDEKAKKVHFTEGKNIITSSMENGNDTGKSILLKSIYHTLGADCFFDGKWDTKEKTYIIDININEEQFFIYRKDNYFKIFSSEFKLLFKTMSRGDLSKFLTKLYGFAVMLPDRTESKLEYAPPAYNYLLNYIDQDKIQTTNFASFKNLKQYSNYKENVLYYHFGVLNEEYYELIKRIEENEEKNKELKEKKEFTENMLNKVLDSINNYDYSKSMETLNIEIENSKQEYNEIIEKLHNTKHKLIDLKNQKQELIIEIEELKLSIGNNEKEIKSIEKHICPVCQSEIDDEEDLLIKKYNTSDDLLILSENLQISIMDLDVKIKREEEKYKEFLSKLNNYEKKINASSDEVNDIIKYKGFIEVKDNLVKEMGEYVSQISEIENEYKELKREKKKYDDGKSKVNEMYKELMSIDKERFGLEEIKDEKIKNIKGSIEASGSNIPITTMIWYFNLLRIKYKFNPNVIRFPIVLDSPKNVEMDKTKEEQFYKYIFDNPDKNSQMIISSLEMSEELLKNFSYDNLVKLENKRYHLLNEEDYIKYKNILLNLTNINE
ncbi:MAG: coiled-coil domain-containing protein [Clostridia bacterium]|mgnify:CR=1 FL=1